jgi:small subunit ribosomal protein S2
LAIEIGIRELLEAGVHFGHQTRRWNPKMRRFIFGERAGIHIIDLQKTERLLHNAQEFVGELAGRGGTVLFVGTKKQARDTIKEAATACGMPYIDQRWLGGLLTNFQTISKRIKRLHDLRDWTESGLWTCCRSVSASAPSPSATSSRRTSAAWPTCSARRTRCS